MFVRIEGKDGLVRDMSSGAIVNTNRTEYENYILHRKQVKTAKDAQAQQAEEINNLKNEISEIKQMLIALLNK